MRLLLFQIFVLLSCLFSGNLFAQGTLSGQVTDSAGKPLSAVQILLAPASGTLSDADGRFEISLKKGNNQLVVRHLGYQSINLRITGDRDSTLSLVLKQQPAELQPVTITGSRYERENLREIHQVAILSNRLIEQTNAVRLFEAIDKVPGVTVVDGQINLRNGSGFNYGAGTRTLLVVDDQPLITADRSDIRWNFLPTELIDQVEVSKGAGSALYGSGALNGVVQLRTFWPGEKPQTRVQLFYQHIDNPNPGYRAWWGNKSPFETGISLAHGRKIGQVDVVASLNLIDTRFYIQASDQNQQRYTLKTRWQPKKVPGLQLQLSSSWMQSSEADFIIWNNADSGVYSPLQATNGRFDGVVRIDRRQFHISPEINYLTAKGGQHKLQGQWYQLGFLNFSQNLITNLYRLQYQYRRPFAKNWLLLAGINRQQFDVDDPNGIGIHQGNTQAVFTQLIYNQQRWNAELAARYESFVIGGGLTAQSPFFKAGANYLLNDKSSLRASVAQGYRFPSLSEMYVSRPNDLLKVFPNPGLKPEYGWTSEIGYKRIFSLSNWQMTFDIALFQMDYRDMTAFVFDLHLPDSVQNPSFSDLPKYLGLQAQNISRARIGGWETSLSSSGKIGPLGVHILAGYTYSYPVDLNQNDSLQNPLRYWGRLFGRMFQAELNPFSDALLKYRNRHLGKLDVGFDYKGWHLGIDYRFYSRIESVDTFFVAIIPGLWDYLQNRSGHEYQFNLRLGYDTGKYGQFMLIGNNLMNRLYTLRFARAEPPRNFVIQYRLRIG